MDHILTTLEEAASNARLSTLSQKHHMLKKLMMGAVHAQEYRQEFDQTYYRQVDNGDQVYAYRYICIVYLHILLRTMAAAHGFIRGARNKSYM